MADQLDAHSTFFPITKKYETAKKRTKKENH
jgi:hypothetical protein